jgi:hypothetical protein
VNLKQNSAKPLCCVVLGLIEAWTRLGAVLIFLLPAELRDLLGKDRRGRLVSLQLHVTVYWTVVVRSQRLKLPLSVNEK